MASACWATPSRPLNLFQEPPGRVIGTQPSSISTRRFQNAGSGASEPRGVNFSLEFQMDAALIDGNGFCNLYNTQSLPFPGKADVILRCLMHMMHAYKTGNNQGHHPHHPIIHAGAGVKLHFMRIEPLVLTICSVGFKGVVRHAGMSSKTRHSYPGRLSVLDMRRWARWFNSYMLNP